MKLVTVTKTTLISVLSCFVVVLTSSFDSQVPGPTHEPVVKTIVIDPGHGGKDPGCSGRNAIEKDIALSLGLKLGALIEKHFPEVKVIYTRTTDVFIPLDERAHIANKAEADLFISIHCNYVSKRNQAQGSETYVMGLHRAEDNLEVAKRENSAILMEDNYLQRYDGYDPDSPEGHIILSMYQNAYLEQSILFADFIEKQFTHGLARKSRGVKQAGFVVLRNTTMPSVLIEAGFLSHDNDEAFLGDMQNHGHVAQSIFKAFSEYKAHVEGYLPAEDNGEIASLEVVPPHVTEVAPREIKTQPTSNGVHFYVQLAASRTPLSPALQKWKVPVPVESKQENGFYKYLAGPFTEMEQANALQSELRAGSCKDAFVVAYRDNQRITMSEATSK